MHPYHIFVVDDEAANLESLKRILSSEGALVSCFHRPADALVALQQNKCDLVLTDLRMDGLSGLDLLESIRKWDSALPVVMMTAYGTVEVAVESLKKGACDFITKPFNRFQLIKVVHQALEKRQLLVENINLKEELKHQSQDLNPIIGKSKVLRDLLDLAYQAARSEANVLIEGESGTGKGLLAEYIHHHSLRSQGIFVKINCTAIPDNLLEAELFGFEQGAFTGAMKRKKGRVELAHQGTLFLDEIGIAPFTFQSKLLRFLQEGEFERLGSNETLKVNARVISATNSELKKAIVDGSLREDLYYRLNVIYMRVPSLRERKEDIPLLTYQFAELAARKNQRPCPTLSDEVLHCFTHYDWPGNVRELQNLIERLVVLCKGGRIERTDLPAEVSKLEKIRTITVPLGMPLRQVEKLLFDQTLKNTEGDKKRAAHLLGVHPRTISRFLGKETDKEDSNLSHEGMPKLDGEKSMDNSSLPRGLR